MPPTDSRATFTVELGDIKLAAAGDATAQGAPTMRGHAAVFDRLSHDLGGYRVKIAPGFFDAVLDANPDVHLVWDHNTRYVLARTKNKSLELRVDPLGLHVWARMANTATSKELATLMEGGYIDQMSFACDIGSSEWAEDAEGNITRTLMVCDALYDVTVCAQGAFPQTDAQLVASLKDAPGALEAAIEAGYVHRPGNTAAVAAETRGTEQAGIAQQDAEGAADVAATRLAEMRDWADARYTQRTQP